MRLEVFSYSRYANAKFSLAIASVLVLREAMFRLFRSTPLKKWQNQHKDLATRAFKAQRNGNIRLYSSLTAEAEALSAKIEALKSEQRQ